MSMAPTNDGEASRDEPDRQSRAMNDELRKDVKAWSAARSAAASGSADNFGVPPPSPPAVKRVRKAKPVAPVQPVATGSKPFSMSYDGVTTAEHIATMLARGAR